LSRCRPSKAFFAEAFFEVFFAFAIDASPTGFSVLSGYRSAKPSSIPI
jgi:hypothetical protein